MGRRISKEFLHPSILEGVNNKIGNLDSLETDAKGNMVQAINELVEKLDNSAEIENGKELIANAVGEPLTAEESFNEMSSDINSLLSTFKTNMMNNGITVESGDKFKALIDKIATMVEEGSGKGIQYASGITSNNFSNVQINGVNFTCLNISLNFKPTILIVRNHGNYGFYIEDFYPDNFNIVTVDNGSDEYRNVKNYEIDKGNNNYSIPIGYVIQKETTYYWAVGVGEEDTTLRDSLASILEEEGVSVTEEDDMASLISKVDSEFDRKNANSGLDIISATELPATGKENQICVITDVKPMSYKMTTNINDKTTNNNEITIYLSDSNSHNMISGTLVPITTGSLTVMYYFNKICQGDKRLKSYIYQNNEWCQITQEQIVLLENGTYVNSTYHGNLSTGSKLHYYEGEAVTIDHINTSWYSIIGAFTKPIDVTSYTKVKCLAYVNPTSSTVNGTAKLYISLHHDNWGYNEFKDTTIYPGQTSGLDALYTQDVTPLPLQEFTFDITEYTGMYYLGIGGYVRCYGHLFITDMWLE